MSTNAAQTPALEQDRKTLADAAREMLDGRVPANLEEVRQAAERVAAGSRVEDRDFAEAILTNLKDGKLSTSDVALAAKLALAIQIDAVMPPGKPAPPKENGGRL